LPGFLFFAAAPARRLPGLEAANAVAMAALAAGRATRAAERITSRACEVRIAHIAAP